MKLKWYNIICGNCCITRERRYVMEEMTVIEILDKLGEKAWLTASMLNVGESTTVRVRNRFYELTRLTKWWDYRVQAC